MRSSSTPLPGTPYKKGDFIGPDYEVFSTLGSGGFGIVYLVYSHETKSVYALKTFRDEYLQDEVTRERFRKEARVWVDLERHPHLVRAYRVDEVYGRLYIAMEPIVPDEQGLNTLRGYLEQKPPDLAQSLRWSIQFCYGMEYAYSRGIRAHRDIKPANIMIAQDKTVKITDFGLAGVLSTSRALSRFKLSAGIGLSGQTMEGTSFGTATHMPPEQFTDAASCDETSDVYAFGVVLYQMASGGKLPFLASPPEDDSEEEMRRFTKAMQRLHSESPLPRLDSPLFPVVRRCLEKERNKRLRSFRELRSELEPLLRSQTGEVVKPPESKALEAWEWGNKGTSLYHLGRYDEAVCSFDRALGIDPRLAKTWNNKGASLRAVGRYEEAIRCHDRALEIDPRFAMSWYNKGASLNELDRYEEAIQCYDRALEIDPRFAAAWNNKGLRLCDLGQHEEAIHCSDRVLEIDPRHIAAWNYKGGSLRALGRHEEAIRCYDRVLEIDPRDAAAWNWKGACLSFLGRYEKAIPCLDRALEIDPRYAAASWSIKGISLNELGRYEEAIPCFDRALEIDPRNALALLWRALAQDELGRKQDAVRSYMQFLALASPQQAKDAQYARQRLQVLEGK